MQKTYHVGFTYTEAGYMTVQEKTRGEAEKLVYSRLQEEGFDAFSQEYQCCHRDFHIHGSEEIGD